MPWLTRRVASMFISTVATEGDHRGHPARVERVKRVDALERPARVGEAGHRAVGAAAA